MSEASSNPKDAPLIREREVLFLDFPGFASAVEQWDDQRMERLIRMLAGIAEAHRIDFWNRDNLGFRAKPPN